MGFFGFFLMLAVIYTLGYFDINIFTAMFLLFFGGIWMLCLFGH